VACVCRSVCPRPRICDDLGWVQRGNRAECDDKADLVGPDARNAHHRPTSDDQLTGLGQANGCWPPDVSPVGSGLLAKPAELYLMGTKRKARSGSRELSPPAEKPGQWSNLIHGTHLPRNTASAWALADVSQASSA